MLLCAQRANAAAATDVLIRATAVTFTVGRNGTYVITVANSGPAATDVPLVVTDPLPDGLSFVSGGGAGWTCSANGPAVTCSLQTSLAVGASSTFTLTVGVCTAAFPSVQNSITVQYPNDTNPSNNTVTKFTSVHSGVCIPNTATPTATLGGATATPTRPLPASTPTSTATPVPAVTDLLLSKTVSGSFTVGGNGTYLLGVSNVGAASTNTLITVTDTLPTGLGFVSASGAGWSCAANGQTVSCQTGSPLAPGSSTRITLTVGVGSAAYPTTTNTATLAYAGDPNTANNIAHRPTTIRLGSATTATATAVVPTAPSTAAVTMTPTHTPTPASAAATDLSITKTTGSTFVTGMNAFYMLFVANVGAASTNAVITVSDVLPNGLGFVSGAGAGWTCSAAGHTVTCITPNPLAPGSSTSVQLTVSVGSAAYPTTTNSATVSYAGDTDPSNDTARRPTTIRLGTTAPAAAAASTNALPVARRTPHRPQQPHHPRPPHRAVRPVT